MALARNIQYVAESGLLEGGYWNLGRCSVVE
jgi:hypothetical protein